MRKIIKSILLIIICTWIGILNVKSQELDFYKQYIHFMIERDILYVQGLFYFSNNGDNFIKKRLFYSFKSEITEINSLKIVDTDDPKENLINEFTEEGVYFYFMINPHEEKTYKISYNQKIEGKKIEYILETQKKWGDSFDQAYFWLELPKNLIIKSFSYQPDTSWTKLSNRHYYWEKHNFTPDKNLIIQWR